MTLSTQRILFVVNKGSGKKKGIDWVAAIEKYFKEFPHEVKTIYMPRSGSPQSLHLAIREFRPQKVVAVGGDGTVTFVANELIGKDLAVGILPAGSANGMAKEIQIPIDPQKALDIVVNGQVQHTDVIRINDKLICLHLSDVGINAQIVKYFQEGSIRGKIGYGLALLKALKRRHRFNIRVQTKNEEVLRTSIMVILANATKYGTGATINPEGSVNDGFFEVVIIRQLGLAEIMKMFLKFQRFNPKSIEMIQARSAVIETQHHAHFQVDGEYIGKVKKVEAKIVPGKLKLLVPAD
jgi:YegS/Rv2252/BmrU family lipid kinase